MSASALQHHDDSVWLGALPGGLSALASWRNADGKIRLASAGSDRTIRIWDPESGEEIAGPLTGHSAVISALTTWTAGDGSIRLASASEDGTIRIWQAATGVPHGIPLTGHAGWVEALTTWELPEGKPWLASGGVDGSIRVWDPDTGSGVGRPWTGHTGTIWALASWVADDGSAMVASGGDDHTVRVWHASTGTPVATPLGAHKSAVWAMASWCTPDHGWRLASASMDGAIEVWDAVSMRHHHSLRGHTSGVKVMTTWVSNEGVRLISASTDGSIRVWDPESGRPVGQPFSRPAGGEAPALATWRSSDGDMWVASPGDGDSILIWDLATGEVAGELSTGHIAGVWALRILPGQEGSPTLASAGGDRTVRLWNTDTGQPVGGPLIGHTAGLWALTSWRSAQGTPRIASAGDDRTIRIWDPFAEQPVGPIITGHTGWIPALISWTEQVGGGTVLASAGDDETIRLWDANTGKAVGSPLTVAGSWVLSLCAWSEPDNSMRLASGHDDGTIHIWDLATRRPLSVLHGHSNWVRALTTYVDSTGRRRLASCGYDGQMRIWDTESGTQLGPPIQVGAGQVGALAVWNAPDGSPQLATGNDEAVIQIWNGDTGLPVGPPLIGHRGGVRAIVSWTDRDSGRTRLASSGYDGDLRLWDADGGYALRTIEVGPVAMWAMSDAPANVDLLGRDALADAVADQLYRFDGGTGPAVVSIEGSWGSGKSTLMEMVLNRMPKPPKGPPEATARMLSVREACRIVRRKPTDKAADGQAPVTGAVAAWFSPWAHQSGEQVWAGLASEIIEAAAQVLYPTESDRERYWLSRNLDRIDRFAVERAMYRRSVSPVLGIALIAVAVPLAIALAQLNTAIVLFGHAVQAASVAFIAALAVLLAGLIHTAGRYWLGRAARYLPAGLLSGPIGAVTGASLASDTERFTDPLWHARAGSLYLHQHDIDQLLRDLNRAGYQMIVFIDDLDRCRSQTTAEVFEAVNLFLSGLATSDGLDARFVIGIDPVVIASHLDEYANPRNPAFALRGDDPSPGWAFLRKLVQLPVMVPGIRDDGLLAFVETATGGLRRPVTPISSASPRVAPRQATSLPRPRSAPSGAADQAATPVLSPGERERTVVETVPWRNLEQHPQVRALFLERLKAQPNRSIREAKRMLNTWQLLARYLSAMGPLIDTEATLTRARCLVILAEITTRWPALQAHLRAVVDGESGLHLLADQVNDDEGWRRAATRLDIDMARNERGLSGLRQLLRDYDVKEVTQLADKVF